MADKRTSEETLAATPLKGTELVRIVDMDEPIEADRTKRTTLQDIADLAGAPSGVTRIDGTAGHVLIQQTRASVGGAKEIVAAFFGYMNDGESPQTYDYPVAFDHQPVIWPNSDPACSTDQDTLTLPANMAGAIDDVIEIKGF